MWANLSNYKHEGLATNVKKKNIHFDLFALFSEKYKLFHYYSC